MLDFQTIKIGFKVTCCAYISTNLHVYGPGKPPIDFLTEFSHQIHRIVITLIIMMIIIAWSFNQDRIIMIIQVQLFNQERSLL